MISSPLCVPIRSEKWLIFFLQFKDELSELSFLSEINLRKNIDKCFFTEPSFCFSLLVRAIGVGSTLRLILASLIHDTSSELFHLAVDLIHSVQFFLSANSLVLDKVWISMLGMLSHDLKESFGKKE